MLARRTVDALAAVLSRRPDAGRVEVLSFHAAAVEQAAAHGLAGRLSSGRTTLPPRSHSGPGTSAYAACASSISFYGRPLVAALRDAGLSVTTGTVNHAAVAERALAYAPDAVTTDRPHELAADCVERRLRAA